jgi:hypothetical protein
MHKAFFLLWVLAFLSACAMPTGSLPFLKPTATCTGGWGPYIGKDMPDLTAAWQAAFRETGLEAQNVKVQGVGETWVSICGDRRTESWGAAYHEILATILVADIGDADLLGATIEKVYRALEPLVANEKLLAGANLGIRFISKTDEDEVLAVNCNYQQGLVLMEEGKNGRELFDSTCTR